VNLRLLLWYHSTMTNNKIDINPVDNAAHVAAEVKAWLTKNVVPLLRDPSSRTARLVESYDADMPMLYMELGGDVPDPTGDRISSLVDTRATLCIDTSHDDNVCVVDPDGSTWSVKNLQAKVNWPSWGSCPSSIARLRIDVIDKACQLAEAFNIVFGKWRIMRLLSTKEEADKRIEEYRVAWARLYVAGAIKAALKDSCKGMRLGSTRMINVTKDADVGIYKDLEVGERTFDATVLSNGSDLTLFLTRVK